MQNSFHRAFFPDILELKIHEMFYSTCEASIEYNLNVLK